MLLLTELFDPGEEFLPDDIDDKKPRHVQDDIVILPEIIVQINARGLDDDSFKLPNIF
jgi:hypothetical protein